MSARSAEDQIRELAQGLAPVRPIPPLRATLAAAVALGLVVPAAHWLLGGPGLRPGGSAVSSAPYLATLAGLLLVAIGALTSSFAAAVPGRERASQRGAAVAASGVVLAIAGGLYGIAADSGLSGERIFESASCIGRALGVGAAPVMVACAFLVYAAVRRPGAGTALALAGGVALGAAAVHVTCPSDSPLHWLLAHALAPVVAALALTAPLAMLLARSARRGEAPDTRDAATGESL
jgi:hypothetical protein